MLHIQWKREKCIDAYTEEEKKTVKNTLLHIEGDKNNSKKTHCSIYRGRKEQIKRQQKHIVAYIEEEKTHISAYTYTELEKEIKQQQKPHCRIYRGTKTGKRKKNILLHIQRQKKRRRKRAKKKHIATYTDEGEKKKKNTLLHIQRKKKKNKEKNMRTHCSIYE